MKTCNIAVFLALHLVRFYMLISNIALTRLKDEVFVKTWNSIKSSASPIWLCVFM